MERKKIPLLISGLAILGIVTSVAMASQGSKQAGRTRRASAHTLRYNHRTRKLAARARSSAAPAGTRVLGYKHAPGQAAAERAAAGHSYMRQAARIKVDPALVERFHVLQRQRRASVSSQVTTAADALVGLADVGQTYGANPSQAAETAIGPGHDEVWLVPGSSGACLVDVEGQQGAGSSCNSSKAVDAGYLWTLDTIPYGAGGTMTQVLLGVVPDGNTSITVSWTDGSTTVVPVNDNIYSVPIGSHAGWKSLTLRNDAGPVVTVPGMPSLP